MLKFDFLNIFRNYYSNKLPLYFVKIFSLRVWLIHVGRKTQQS